MVARVGIEPTTEYNCGIDLHSRHSSAAGIHLSKRETVSADALPAPDEVHMDAAGCWRTAPTA